MAWSGWRHRLICGAVTVVEARVNGLLKIGLYADLRSAVAGYGKGESLLAKAGYATLPKKSKLLSI
jgi:hypothetical protein